MPPLTWQNVDAPDLRTAGALQQGAGDAWQSAMTNLQTMFADTRTRRQDKSSAAALMGAAGITDPEQLKAYLASVDPSKLNSEASTALADRMGKVLDYQYRSLQSADLAGDIQNERYTRGRDAQFNQQADAFSAVQMQAAEMAENGDREGAQKLVQDFVTANPQMGEAGMTARSGLNTEYTAYLGEQTNNITQRLIEEHGSKQDAIAAIRDDKTIPEELKTMVFNQLGSVDDTLFTATNSNANILNTDFMADPMPGLEIDGGGSVAKQVELNQMDSAVNRELINTQLNSNPYYQNQKVIADMSGELDYKGYLSKTFNISEDGWIQSNLDVLIEDVMSQANANATGNVNITKEMAAAAIAQTYDTGVIPMYNRDVRSADVQAAASLAREMNDPATATSHLRSTRQWEQQVEVLDRLDRQLAQKEQEILRFQNSNPERAAEAQEAYIALLAQQRQANAVIGAQMGLQQQQEAARAEPGAVHGRGTADGPKAPPPPPAPRGPDGNGGNPITPPTPLAEQMFDPSTRNNMPPVLSLSEDLQRRWSR